MYAISLSSGLFLLDKPAMAVAVAAVGVILGWPFSILAFLPVTIFSLVRKFKEVFITGAVTSAAFLVSLIAHSINLVSLLDLQSYAVRNSKFVLLNVMLFMFMVLCGIFTAVIPSC